MKTSSVESKWKLALSDWIHRLAYWLLMLGGLGLVCTIGYLAYGIFSGAFGNYISLQQLDQIRFKQNVEISLEILHYGFILLIAGLILWQPGKFAWGWGLAIGGTVFEFGIPFLFQAFMGNASVTNKLLYAINLQVIQSGELILIIGLAAGVIDSFIRLYDAWQARRRRFKEPEELELLKQKADEKQEAIGKIRRALPHAFKPCWELPACREYMRVLCPAYKKGKTCWKCKTGCLCDEDFLLKALDSAHSNRKSDLAWLVRTSRDESPRQKIQCKTCAIRNQHQAEKHRLLSYFALPVSCVIGYLLQDIVRTVYQGALVTVDRVVQQISMAPGAQTHQVSSWVTNNSQVGIIEWLLIISLVLWAVNLYDRVIEYFVLKLKW